MAYDNNKLCVENICNDWSSFSWTAVSITHADSTYTIRDQAIIIEADVLNGAINIQLSSMPHDLDNQVLWIRKVDATHTGNPVTILPQAGYTVLGGASYVLTKHLEILTIYRDKNVSDWKTLTNRVDQISPTTTKGDILVHNGLNLQALGVGADGLVLVADASQPTGVRWGSAIGSGDVLGPGSSTDNAVVRFDGTTGKVIQNSGVILDDLNNLSGVNNIALSGTVDGRDVSTDGATLDSHVANFSNPHHVTAAQVGNTVAQWNANQLQSTNVSASAPTDGDSLVYDSGAGQWVPTHTFPINMALERITAVGGGVAVSPTLNKNLTFITTTGAGTATGTLNNGSATKDGFEKVFIAEALACPYALTVTSLVDAAGSIGTKTLTFTNTGQSARLLWSNATLHWYLTDTGVTVS